METLKLKTGWSGSFIALGVKVTVKDGIITSVD